ncbi:MAG: hypothetical protein ACRDB9_08460 [Cetobacterium sp.]
MKLKTLNKMLENTENQLRKIKINKNNIGTIERKKRVKNLVMIGALFEILGYSNERGETILGFLKENIELINKNRDYYFNIGEKILAERKAERQKQNESLEAENNNISNEELKKLLIFCTNSNFDVGLYIQETFKKTLWENLTSTEFKKIQKYWEEQNEKNT